MGEIRFKIGGMVRIQRGLENQHLEHYMSNKPFKILDIIDGMIYYQGSDPNNYTGGWFPRRFELAQTPKGNKLI